MIDYLALAWQNNFFPRILIIRGMTFKFEYLGEFEFIFEKNLGALSWAQELPFDEKKWRSKISCKCTFKYKKSLLYPSHSSSFVTIFHDGLWVRMGLTDDKLEANNLVILSIEEPLSFYLALSSCWITISKVNVTISRKGVWHFIENFAISVKISLKFTVISLLKQTSFLRNLKKHVCYNSTSNALA